MFLTVISLNGLIYLRGLIEDLARWLCHFWTEDLVNFLPFDFKSISSVIRSAVQFWFFVSWTKKTVA